MAMLSCGRLELTVRLSLIVRVDRKAHMKRLVVAALIAVAAVVPSVALAREERTQGGPDPSPRPTPAVVGVPFATPAASAEVLTDVTGEVLDAVGGPSVTLPPTDTE